MCLIQRRQHMVGLFRRDQRILCEDEVFRVTDEGLRRAHCFANEVLALPENREINDRIDRIVSEYAPQNTGSVLERVNAMTCVPVDGSEPQLIAQMPQFTHLTAPLSEHEARQTITVPIEWRMTLEMTFNDDAVNDINAAIEDTYQGRLLTSEEMWANA